MLRFIVRSFGGWFGAGVLHGVTSNNHPLSRWVP
jgi:hypothetical protein